MTKPRRIAMLIELPAGLENASLAALRRFLKSLVRVYGIRCLSVVPPSETRTFGSQAGSASKIEPAAQIDAQTHTKPSDANALDAKPAGLAKPKKRRSKNLSKGSSA